MNIYCSQEIFEKFPEASIHGVVFDRLDLVTDEIAAEWRLRASQSVSESGITTETLVESPAVKEWRRAFQTFGLKPSKYRSSIEQLFRRALKGEIIQTPLPLVNLYCYVSIINQTPMGGDDLRLVKGDIAIRAAVHSEEFTVIGDSLPIKSEAGVVVYADEAGIICWGWNHRDCARTALNDQTTKAVFFADSAVQESHSRAAEAIRGLSEILSTVGCLEVGSFALNSRNRSYSVDV